MQQHFTRMTPRVTPVPLSAPQMSPGAQSADQKALYPRRRDQDQENLAETIGNMTTDGVEKSEKVSGHIPKRRRCSIIRVVCQIRGCDIPSSCRSTTDTGTNPVTTAATAAAAQTQ